MVADKKPGLAPTKTKTFGFNSLHKHDGRGILFLQVLLRTHGSIIPRILPIALFSTLIACALMIVDKYDMVPRASLPILKHPVAIQMFGIVLGYVVVLRSNMAIRRYFEGISNVQFYGSKWSDALTQLCAFIRTSAIIHQKNGRIEKVQELKELQFDLIHWFSLLHALAINSLQVTQLDLEDDHFFARMEESPLVNVELFGITGTEDGKPPMLPGPLPLSQKRNVKRSSVGTVEWQDQKAKVEKGAIKMDSLTILGKMSNDEMIKLKAAEDKVDLIHSWIVESISDASLNQIILTQSPILSRVYQELSNGMLGYNQAYKIALVQFPFAFAQILTMFLVAWVFCCPIAVYVFTGGEFLTPCLTLFTVLGFWGIHEIAVEVENPFGVDPNQLPLVPLHESVVEAFYEASYAARPFPDPDSGEHSLRPISMQGNILTSTMEDQEDTNVD